ncbi:MAG TPA: VOC family protein [Thermomicrobiales bacterium]|nr:VOC family protein [Thermomicrobiales bacterium]
MIARWGIEHTPQFALALSGACDVDRQELNVATVRYFVNDVDACVTFYVEQLGFSVSQQLGPLAMVNRGDLELWLSGPQTSAARPMPDGSQPVPGGWNRLVIQVDDIDAVVATMRAAGARFRNDIISGPGGRQILAEDPAGNPIELFQPRA